MVPIEARFTERVLNRSVKVCVVGLGYVGLPLAIAFAEAGFYVHGYDVDVNKIEALRNGVSYLSHIPASEFVDLVKDKRLALSSSNGKAFQCDAVIICVPTPLDENRAPNLEYVESSVEALAKVLKPGQLVCLESTTYPGTTSGRVREILEARGLVAGTDFFLVYSPERQDPGNPVYKTTNIPKVVGGYTERCTEAGVSLYGEVIDKVVPVSSCEAAEMTKIFENIYRMVNIGLVNELKLLCHRMGIDEWEVVRAAATKPFGFHSFKPGPGVGGHCLPVDPFYLTWRARQFGMYTKFVELAGEINMMMPEYVVRRTREALNDRGRCTRGARILVLGAAYKPNVEDIRESPALKIMELFEKTGARVEFYDPYVEKAPHGISVMKKNLPKYLSLADAVVLVTDHDDVDYEMVEKHSRLIIDTRGKFKAGSGVVNA